MRTFTGLLIMISLMLSPSLVLAEPFAPKVDVPKKMLEPTHPDALDAMMSKNSKVPEKHEVGIPCYQGAKIIYSQQPSRVKINGKELKPNHMIFMGTDNKVDQVYSFYKEKLPDWSYKEKFGTHIFYEGDGKFDLMDESSMTTPHVQIREAYPQESPLMPDMNTVIEVYYRP